MGLNLPIAEHLTTQNEASLWVRICLRDGPEAPVGGGGGAYNIAVIVCLLPMFVACPHARMQWAHTARLLYMYIFIHYRYLHIHMIYIYINIHTHTHIASTEFRQSINRNSGRASTEIQADAQQA